MITATIENVLNRGIPRSPRARQLCIELAGRRVAVNARGLVRFVVGSAGESITLVRDPNVPVDAEITGSPFALLELAGNAPEAVIQRGDVQIRGDTELAQKFRELALLLRPDVEEELALVIGDMPAHQIGRFARMTLGWGRRAADTAVRNVSEFLSHERGDLVSKPEGNQFLKRVDTLREDADRIEARVERIRQQVEAQSQAPAQNPRTS
jgi:ubiquinone biosynthesis accessory factor UbiJ